MRITNEKIDEAIEYSVKTIHHICENIGPRESGTKKEEEAQLFLKKELDENGWADEALWNVSRWQGTHLLALPRLWVWL